MKVTNPFKLLFSLGALLICLPRAFGADTITADAGGNPVAFVSRYTAFGPAHSSSPYTAVHLTKNGQNYVPTGSPEWVRYQNASGTTVEEHASNFGIASTTVLADDRWFANTYRPVPDDAIEAVASVTNGQPVVVQSRVLSKVVEAVVQNIGNGYIITSYPALEGDSAAKVRTTSGRLVGFVSKTIKEPGKPPVGSVVVTPQLDVLAGTRPVPPNPPPPPVAGTNSGTPPIVVNPPPSLPPPVTPEEAYANGLADGRAQVKKLLSDFIANLK